MRAIIFDTETTGIENPEVIETAWMDVQDPSQIAVVMRFKPSKPITLGALATHHILPSELEHEPPSSEFRLPDGVEYLIGFNVDFDWMAIGSPPNIKRIDLCPICRTTYPGLDSYSQSAMMYYLFGATQNTRNLLTGQHSAAVDVYNCFCIYEKLLKEAGATNDFEAIWRWSEECRVPSVMPFGKFQGKPISEVDESYRRWYRGCTNPPPDQYILKAFEKYPAQF